jgi:hypothetical protein
VLTEAGLQDWLVDPITAALEADSGNGAVALAQALESYPDIQRLLPADISKSAASVSQIATLLAGAQKKVIRGETKVLTDLYGAYPSAGEKARAHLRKTVPELLLRAKRLDRALRGCPAPIRWEFCHQVRFRLTRFNADPDLAAAVFAASLELDRHGERDAADELIREFAEVLNWSGGQRRALRKTIHPDYAQILDEWLEDHRGGAMVKIRGLIRGHKDGEQ